MLSENDLACLEVTDASRSEGLGFFRILEAESSQWPSYERLFREAFGSEVSKAVWDYKYGFVDHASLIAFHEDEVAGFYGAIPRRWWMGGELTESLQLCDVMVSPRFRGILGRQGLLARMALRVRDQKLGSAAKRAFAFGFPNERHLRLGVKLSLYREVEHLSEVSWHTGEVKGPRPWVREIGSSSSLSALGDRLWPEMALDLADFDLGERNGSYLVSRYFQHPTRIYRRYAVFSPWTFRPCALIVLEVSGKDCRLMDWVAAGESIPLAIKASRMLGGRWGFERVLAWSTQGMLQRISRDAVTVAPSGPSLAIMMPEDPKEKKIDPASRPFWITMGDCDFL